MNVKDVPGAHQHNKYYIHNLFELFDNDELFERTESKLKYRQPYTRYIHRRIKCIRG